MIVIKMLRCKACASQRVCLSTAAKFLDYIFFSNTVGKE